MQFIAHRGLHDVVPENTIDAFQRAIDAGFDGVELDAHTTQDGVCVVHHDYTVVTPSASLVIAKNSYAAVLKANPAIPRLSDVLDLLANKLHVYIELKGHSIEHEVAQVIQASHAECSVHSFDHHAVARFKSILPNIRTGILQSSRLMDSVHALQAAGAQDLWQWYEFVDRHLVEAVQAIGGQVICWTADEPQLWHEFREMGVAGICTDLSPLAKR